MTIEEAQLFGIWKGLTMAAITAMNCRYIERDHAASLAGAFTDHADNLMRQYLDRVFPMNEGTSHGPIVLEAR